MKHSAYIKLTFLLLTALLLLYCSANKAHKEDTSTPAYVMATLP